MPEFDADREPIHVFKIEDTYLFKHYFERTDLFADLEEFYNDDEYRFEVPADEYPDVKELLEGNYYTLHEVDTLSEFTVVKEMYTPHADILRNSVMHWTRRDHDFFVMKDPTSVDQAVERGATRIDESDLVLGI